MVWRVGRGGSLGGGAVTGRLGDDRGLLLRAAAAAELVLVAGALALTAALPGAAARDGIAALLDRKSTRLNSITCQSRMPSSA